MKYLQVFAGPSALSTIQKKGFDESLFSSMLGASGGPKWFCLYEVDRYLMGDFFKQRTKPLDLLGSSAGAYRFAALAQNDPLAGIQRMADFYSNVCYEKGVSIKEITQSAFDMIDHITCDNGVADALNNKKYRAHFILSEALEINNKHQIAELSSLAKSFMLNSLSRRKLAKQYTRQVFCHPDYDLNIDDPYNIPTQYHSLNQNNFKHALYASGAIPMAMEGVSASHLDVKHLSENSLFMDGGILDYHFDLNINAQTSDSPLVLYPHFTDQPRAGWFDRILGRKPLMSSYDNVVMLAPTQLFLDRLPYNKISDRKDFKRFDDKVRIAYWKKVLELSQYLADDFKTFVDNQLIEEIKDVNFCQ